MAAAVEIAMRYLRERTGDEPPLHVIGYSNGGALAAAGAPEGAAVLAYEPLHVTSRCARPALQIPLGADARALGALAERYDIDWVVTAPSDHPQAEWRQVAVEGFSTVGERVLRRASAAP